MPKSRLVLLLLIILLSACSTTVNSGSELQIIASTSIVGDVVRQVGGEYVEVHVLIPADVDPHGFDPSPREIAQINEADIVFISGAGLEEDYIDLILQSLNETSVFVDLSTGLELLEISGESNSAHSGEGEDEADHQGVYDPHVWLDPDNVIAWTAMIEMALIEADPEHQAYYQEAAGNYQLSLEEMSQWIEEQIRLLPAENRVIVSDHQFMAYFASRFGVEISGLVVQSISTMAESSAQEFAALADMIIENEIPAIFITVGANSELSEQLADDLGLLIVPLYVGGLSSEDGPAGNYIDMMQYNVSEIIQALE